MRLQTERMDHPIDSRTSPFTLQPVYTGEEIEVLLHR
jgi:hypothetical protein